MATRRISFALSLLACSCYAPHSPVTSVADEGESNGASSDVSSGDSTGASPTASESATEPGSGSSGVTLASGDTSSDGSDTTPAVCGNGTVEKGEVCDDGVNDGSYGGCSDDCSELGPHCGDALVNGDEACDDGENVDGHGCNHDCVVSGTMLWALQYDGDAGTNDRAYGVAVDSSNQVIVVGQENSSRGWIRAYDPDGNTIWSQVNEGEAGGFAYRDVAVDPNDDIAAAGLGLAAGQGQGQMAQVRKYDTFDGATLWTDTLSDETLDQWASGVAADSEGYFTEIGLLWPDILVRRLSPDGDEMWRRLVSGTTGGGYSTTGSKVAIDDEGNIVCLGLILQPEGLRIWTRKYDSNGGTLWTRIADDVGPSNPTASDIAMDSNGNSIFVAGVGTGEIIVRKLDADGNALWTDDAIDAGFEMAYLRGVATDSADNIVVTGRGGADADIAALKYDGDGELLWSQLLTNNGTNNSGEAVATDSTDNIVVVGSVLDASTDMWIAKLAP